jgi:hypothetical protein
MEVQDFLIERLPQLFEVDFTAKLEERLDEVEEGKLAWTDLMRDFHGKLTVWIEEAKAHQVDKGLLRELLDLADQIQSFNPPVKRGKKQYCDDTFVREIREELEKGGEVTDRQLDNLRKVVARYYKQIPGMTPEVIERLELKELVAKETESSQPPRPETLLKFAMLEDVEFAPPRQVGKKTYDDAEFSKSLREQMEGGKRLSDNQVMYLDRLVQKYAAQIPGYETRALAAGLSAEVEEDRESGPLLELLAEVKTFAEPTVSGKKTWDDAEFADSLRKQYESRKNLTPRQRSALKRILLKYREQISAYELRREELGLPVPGAPRGRKKRA